MNQIGRSVQEDYRPSYYSSPTHTEIFIFDERLGVKLLNPNVQWMGLTEEERQAAILQWEENRGAIRARLVLLNTIAVAVQNSIEQETDWEKIRNSLTRLSEIGSRIADLEILNQQELEIRPDCSNQ